MSWSDTRAHLIELRSRVIKCCSVISVFFVIFFIYANALFQFLAQPLLQYLPQGHLIAVGLTTPLTTPIRLSLLLSILTTLPYLFYQLWAFIAPGLYQRERDLILRLVIPSVLLFYSGLAFAYYVVFPLIFSFFARFIPDVVQLTPDMGHYFDFIFSLFLAFGLCFEVPIFMVILARLGLVNLEQFQEFRAYFIVVAFTVGMLLTPPDVLSQVMLAIPMCGLYEVGLWLIKLSTPALADDDIII